MHVPDEMDIDDLILSECIILMDGIMITPRTQAVIDRQRKLAMETTKQQTSVSEEINLILSLLINKTSFKGI